MVKAIALFTTAVLALSSINLGVKADCECGYLDPSTNHLWTDAAFSFFNETGLDDIVMNPAKSPKPNGNEIVGDTGDGQQTWSAVGNHINPYEESFGATYLSAVSYNTTYIDNRTSSEGIAMEVSPANQKTHVVNGSTIVTRRRDILYGSFRANIKPPFINPIPGSDKGYGSGFEFTVAYNDSERMHVNILTHDYMPNSTLGWSFAAARWDDSPVTNNLTYFQNFTQTNSTDFLEHRMEWLNETVIQYKNNAANRSVGFFEFKKGQNTRNLPTTPAPVSLQAWANGEPSSSQGPPTYEPNVARVMYTRFFFNSSRIERHDQFVSQCAAAASSAKPVCSTEDPTLRTSTPFDLAATEQFKPKKDKFKVPIWAVVIELFFLTVLIITLVHGLYIRKIKDAEKKRKAAALSLAAEEEKKQAALLEYDDISEATDSPRSKAAADFEKPYKQIWAVPELVNDWDSDGESDIDEDDARFWESVDVMRSKDYKDDREEGEPGLPQFDDPTAIKPTASVDDMDDYKHVPTHDVDDAAPPARNTFLSRFDEQSGNEASRDPLVRSNSATRGAAQFNLVNRPNFPRQSSNMRQQMAGRMTHNTPYGSTPGGDGVGGSPRFEHFQEEVEELDGGSSPTSSNSNNGSYPPVRPDFSRFDSYESDIQVPTHSHDAARTQRYLQDSSSNVSLPYVAPKFASSTGGLGLHSANHSTASLLNYTGSGGGNQTGVGASHGYSSSVNINWDTQPRIIQWNKRKSVGVDLAIGQLAQPAMGDKNAARRLSTVVVPAPNNGHSFFTIIYQRVYGWFFITGDGMKTAAGDARIDYLDGMRGFACLFVSLGHFILMFWNSMANHYGPHHYHYFELWIRMLFGPIVINAGLVLGIFFVLPSRTMGSRYLVKGGVQSLADNSVRRMPRLIIPCVGAVLCNYMMIDVGAYKWVAPSNSLTWSTWSYFQNYDNVLDFLNSFIALWFAGPPDQPALVTRYATGVLWTIPVIVQGAWTCMLCAVFAHEIKTTWKRFFFYFLCILLSWYAQTWDLYFMAGLVIADLDINLKYRKWGEMGIPLLPKAYAKLLRIPERVRQRFALKGKSIAWGFFLACCVQEWLMYIPGAPAENFDTWEVGVHPNFYNSRPNEWNNDVGYKYQRPRTSAWFFVMSIFILADHSQAFRQVFKLRIWSFLGKHSMAYFLLHGIIFWTWGSWLCVHMLTAGINYFATVMVVFVTCYILLTVFCIAFTYTFEYWGIIASKAFWRATSGNLGRRAGA
ncbi:Acyltransferase 3 [Kalmanozyma brasiliensis GHG001]|uniref:Acyltransferase 3 domain-containing protein n=1 Tax=Kalmanozyma brasiliensis (strain GHG001) TaxID=1365824 RepID=V5EBP5_KALBG|nr:Acyltransferase 3 [Kalmanozyma brasiliensis GHG001]EST07846.1 Acyltransferase 3 [Kalmanozyma brasiliensis GHG001]